MRRWKKTVLWVMCLALMAGCSFSPKEKPHITGSPCFGVTKLTQRLEENDPIIIGTVVEKSAACFEHIVSNNLEYGWLYHEVYVEVTSCYSGSVQPGDVLVFYELGGENERYRFTMQDAPIVQEGEAFLIASPARGFITPYTFFAVDHGSVTLPFTVLPDSYGEVSTVTFTVDELSVLLGEPDTERIPVEPEQEVE